MNVILTVDKTVWEICLSIAQSISQSMAQYDSQPAMSLSVSLSTTISSGKQNYYITLTLILLLVTSQVKQNDLVD